MRKPPFSSLGNHPPFPFLLGGGEKGSSIKIPTYHPPTSCVGKARSPGSPHSPPFPTFPHRLFSFNLFFSFLGGGPSPSIPGERDGGWELARERGTRWWPLRRRLAEKGILTFSDLEGEVESAAGGGGGGRRQGPNGDWSLSLSLSSLIFQLFASLFFRDLSIFCATTTASEGGRGKVEKCKAFQMAQIVRHFFLFLLPSELHSPVDPSLPAHSV